MKNTSLVLAAALLIAIPLTTRAAPPIGDLKQRLTDAAGRKSWPVSVKAYGPVRFITYDCEYCRAGGFAFLDSESQLVTFRTIYDTLEYKIEHDPAIKAAHSQVLLTRGGETFRGMVPGPGGGQRFLFSQLVGECEACQPFTAIRFAFDFDVKGSFKGAHNLGFVSVADARGTSPPIQQ